jgi:hypothetical protein
MTGILLAAYKAFPLRPHCSLARHTLLCRLITPHLPAITCKGDKPDWKDWQR